MNKIAVAAKTFGVFACINTLCAEGEFSAEVTPIWADLPGCPGCGCPSVLLDVLWRREET